MPNARMILTLLIALAITAGSAASAATGPRRAKAQTSNQEWAPPTFHGLRIGVSTTLDVIRTFGKPERRGGVEDLIVESDTQGEIQYQYRGASGVDGDMLIYFGKRSGVISAILVYPNHMTRADAIAQFGDDFEESNEKLGACPTDREKAFVGQYHIQYCPLLVYRKLGLFVDIKGDGYAFQIAYLRSCR